MSSYVERTIAAFERLETENAELRELVRHLFWWDSCSRYTKGCQECVAKMDCDGKTCIFWNTLRDRARELGVETDE